LKSQVRKFNHIGRSFVYLRSEIHKILHMEL
jgi:hypothetical protein